MVDFNVSGDQFRYGTKRATVSKPAAAAVASLCTIACSAALPAKVGSVKWTEWWLETKK